MGTEITITECDIEVKDRHTLETVLFTSRLDEGFLIDGYKLERTEYTRIFPDNGYVLFATIAHFAEGFLAFYDSLYEYWKIELKDGKITEYKGTVSFEKAEPVRQPEHVIEHQIIFISDCNVTVKDPAKAGEILDKYTAPFTHDGTKLLVTECAYKTQCDEYELFAELANVAEGYVVFNDLYANYWKYEMKNGKAYCYPRYKIVYEKRGTVAIPPEFVEKKHGSQRQICSGDKRLGRHSS